MVTTRRSSNSSVETLTTSNSNVALLERKIPNTYNEYNNVEAKVEEVDLTQEKERRQKNLEKLLNYDRYSETYSDVSIPLDEVKEEIQAVSDDDIRPTSTTMQFGDNENIEKIYNEMATVNQDENSAYKLNRRGKVVIAMYALAVTIIMALIVLNTSILSVLSRQNVEKTATLNQIISEYSQVNEEIELKTSDEYISSVAQNEYGMQMK